MFRTETLQGAEVLPPLDVVSGALRRFKAISRRYACFHGAFLAAGVLELLAFLLFFSVLTRSSVLAYALAAVLFTSFSYCVLLFYFQARKPEQLAQLVRDYLQASMPSAPRGSPEYHLARAGAASRLASAMEGLEEELYLPLKKIEALDSLADALSSWLHGEDIRNVRESLLRAAIRETVELVQTLPSDREAHASLAALCVERARLHAARPLAQEALQHAIEEYRIIDRLTPGDPQVHERLAGLYRQLGMADEELKEREALYRLTPDDSLAAYRLGALYFELGRSADGLALYDLLRQSDKTQAGVLIQHYGIRLLAEQDAPV
jgi:tetratricopeptide (TPR) repeat protein